MSSTARAARARACRMRRSAWSVGVSPARAAHGRRCRPEAGAPSRSVRLVLGGLAAARLAAGACSSRSDHRAKADAGAPTPADTQDASQPTVAEPFEPVPDDVDAGSFEPEPPREGPRCPADMVRVAGHFCVDRYE